jgi:hypothetical protein
MVCGRSAILYSSGLPGRQLQDAGQDAHASVVQYCTGAVMHALLTSEYWWNPERAWTRALLLGSQFRRDRTGLSLVA